MNEKFINEKKVLESINEIKTELPNEEKDNTEAVNETMIEKSEEEFESMDEIKAELPNEVNDNNEAENETMIKKLEEELKSLVYHPDEEPEIDVDKLPTFVAPKNTVLDEASYMKKYGLIKEGQSIPFALTSYYNGHPYIDSFGYSAIDQNGNFHGRQFYVWIDNDTLYLLDNDLSEGIGRIELELSDIQKFSSILENATAVHFIHDDNIKVMFLDNNIHKILKSNIPDKEYIFTGNVEP